MKLKKIEILIVFVLTLILFTSCASRKKILYFQNSDVYKEKTIESEEHLIHTGDILKIEIGSLIADAAIPYNKFISVSTSSEGQIQGYIVDKENKIKLPILGELSTKEMTLSQLESYIKDLLIKGKQLKNPTVSVSLLNFKITILGEVNKPGTYYINEPNLNLLQAFGLAGDLTISGKRKDILLIRQFDDKSKTYHIDLTDISLLEKNYYQLKSNDVIIVDPNYSKVKQAGSLGDPSVIVSIASLFLGLIVLFNN